MNRTVRFASAIVAVGALGTSAAMAAEGPYVGAGILQSRFDSDHFSVDDVDDDAISWKILAGYKFTPTFGIEAGYIDFGKSDAPSLAVGGPFKAEAEAFSLFGTGSWPVGPVDLFVKVGAARVDADGNVGAVLFENKETEFAYGAGAQFNMGPLGIRAEYEKFDTDVIGDLDVISLSAVFTFGAGT
jgi:hypothetical protein